MKHKKEKIKNKDLMKSIKDAHKEKEGKHKKKKGKIAKVMKEFSEKKLHSGSKKGPEVKSKAQALAIGYSEAKKAGEKVAPKKKSKKK